MNTRAVLIPCLAVASLLAGAFAHRVHANTPDSVDPSFQIGTGVGPAGAYLESVAVKPDGKIVIGGAFNQFNGVTCNNVAQLDADGRLDPTFNPGVGPDSYGVYSVAVQLNNKVVIGGFFEHVNGTTREHIAQLNADGTLDTTFDPGTGTDGTVYSVATQPDGKVVIGGEFTQVNGVTRENIARLNADGSVDTQFGAGTGANALIYAIAVQTDGKIVIAGEFNQVNGVTRDNIARLNADGSVDTTFDAGTGPDNQVTCVALQNDGRIVIGGYFNTVNGVVHNCIAQLNADGSVDPTFDPGIGANEPVEGVTTQGDGKVILAGYFSQINNVTRYSIARLNADGSVDASFAPVLNSLADCAAVQGDGKILIGGSFGTVNGVTLPEVARLIGGSVPAITSAPSAAGAQGSPLSYQITATGNPTRFGVQGLSAGLTVNAKTGLISGTPRSAGTVNLTLNAYNSLGKGSAALTLMIAAAPPVVTSATTASGTTGKAFSYQIAASNAPTAYGVQGLPGGLNVNANTGLISGAPRTAGTYTLTLNAYNGAGKGSITLTLTVALGLPVVTSASTALGKIGAAFSYQIVASGSPTSYGVQGLPGGLAVNAATGLLSGTPKVAGTFTLTLNAYNSVGKGSGALTLTVSN